MLRRSLARRTVDVSSVGRMTESRRPAPSPAGQQLDRSRSVRAATAFVIAALVLITLICGVFLLSGVELPDWLTVIGRWIPAVVSLGVIVLFRLPNSVGHWWMLRPGGMRRLFGGLATGVLGLAAIYALAAAVGVSLGLATPLTGADYLQIALLTVPMALLFSLSTLGEEAAWRAFLPQLVPGMNRWGRAITISGIWVVFHIPLHGTMILQGTLDPSTGIVSTLLLLPLGVFLAMLVERFGSVWPAVIAHAVPMSVLNLVANAAELPSSALWGLAGITAITLTIGAVIVAPIRR